MKNAGIKNSLISKNIELLPNENSRLFFPTRVHLNIIIRKYLISNLKINAHFVINKLNRPKRHGKNYITSCFYYCYYSDASKKLKYEKGHLDLMLFSSGGVFVKST